MNDPISRQAAIDALDGEIEITGRTNAEAVKGYVRLVRDRLERLPSAQQWTPVSEGMPKKNGRYFVTRGLNACGALWNRVYVANYSDLMGLKSEKIWWQGNVGKSDFERLDDVIAWMPLPESWKLERRIKMRPIDADAIKLEKGFFEKVDNVPKFFEWLGKQPTINMVSILSFIQPEQKKGRWIYSTNSESVCEEWTCSLCGAFSFEKTNFCHNCGADMRGEKND